jgi:hypothetical protein
MRDQGFVIGQYDWLKTQGGRPAGERRYAILRVGKIKTKGQLGAALSLYRGTVLRQCFAPVMPPV